MEAGFDGVELHAANGYLFDQFFNPSVNDRQDDYSSTMENRIRFAVEVVEAVGARIGFGRIGIRISPYGQLYDMPLFPDILETFEALGRELAKRSIAYVHIMDQTDFFMSAEGTGTSQSDLETLLRRLKAALGDTSLILAGRMTRDRAESLISAGLIDLAAFGIPFIANPDLVARLKNDHPLSEPIKETFYGGGSEGYTDYPPYQPA
jgi:2,4-dienoyl-CoA reductase-like NADH-dependent reductase (Old Yellow Enzyme family)